jgi:uncharacterized membrane protein
MEGSAQQPPSEEVWREEVLRELAALKRRVEAIERALLKSASIPQQELKHQTAPVPTPAPPRPAPSPEPDPRIQGQPSALESRIGAQLFNRVGVFAVLAGAAWFLKLAIDREWIGPTLRVLIGLITAAGLMVWSEHFRRTGARSFSFTLKALGSGIAYLSLWACFSLYHLLPATPVFAAMVAVTVVNAALAWRQNSELLAALALAGGLATPALFTTGGDQELFLLSYLLLLDIGAIALTALRPWPSLTIGAFTGTTVYLALGWTHYYTSDSETLTAIFLTLFFAVFTVAPFAARKGQQSQPPTNPPNVAPILTWFPIAVGVCAFLEAFHLLLNIEAANAPPWLAILLGAIYLALVIASSLSAKSATAPNTLSVVHLSLAVGFFALAGPLKFHAKGIALSWLAELILLALASAYFDGRSLARILRACTSVLLLLSFCALLVNMAEWNRPTASAAFANPQFATSVTGLVAFAIVIFLGIRALGAASETGGPTGSPLRQQRLEFDGWLFSAAAAILAFNLIALISVDVQIDLYWNQQLPHIARQFPNQDIPVRHPAYIDFTQSAWFMLYGAALMAIGFWRRSAFLRWQALILFTLSIGKVFLFDTSHLHEGYRVASFLGLGILLLTVSFAYQKDWLGLRTAKTTTDLSS